MQTTLVTLGAVAVMAAIVGGGLKAAHIEFGPLNSVVRQVLLGGFGIVLIVLGLEPWQWDLPLDPDPGEERSEIAVPATQPWTATGIDLEPGDELRITAGGEIRDDINSHPQRMFGPDGVPDTQNEHPGDPFKDEGFNHAALVGRIGETGGVFEIGSALTCSVSNRGRLSLAINDGVLTDNDGEYKATIVVNAAPSRSSLTPCSRGPAAPVTRTS